MRYIIIILLILINILSYGQSDTNIVDDNNYRQGYWKIYGKEDKSGEYSKNDLVAEGHYNNHKKIGMWKIYFPNGVIKKEGIYKEGRKDGEWKEYFNNKVLKNKIVYERGIPNGSYEFYYPNGQLKEKGIWENKKNVGELSKYYNDGCLEYFSNLLPSGFAEIKHYDTCDCLSYEIVFDKSINSRVYKEYENCKLSKTKPFQEENKKSNINIEIENYTNDDKFDNKDYQKIFNTNNQIEKFGIFKNGKLVEGNWYKYNEKNVLISIEIYKKGKYVGEAPIE